MIFGMALTIEAGMRWEQKRVAAKLQLHNNQRHQHTSLFSFALKIRQTFICSLDDARHIRR